MMIKRGLYWNVNGSIFFFRKKERILHCGDDVKYCRIPFEWCGKAREPWLGIIFSKPRLGTVIIGMACQEIVGVQFFSTEILREAIMAYD